MLNKQEIEKLKKENDELIIGLQKILKLNTYMINCSSQKVIYKFLFKQQYLIYKILGEEPPGLAYCSKGEDKE